MVNFIGVEIEGFCNIQSLYYRLNRPGINILRAPNGTGKTKVFSSLSWGLFGNTLGESNNPEPWEDKKGKNYKGTKVKVDFTKGSKNYSVIRCKNYKGDLFGYPGKNRVVLCEDGKPLDKLRDTKDVQLAIDRVLGYSFIVFKNSIVFGQKLTRLISESGPNKKEILEEIFNITFIEEAKERAKKKLSEINTQYNSLVTEIKVLESSIKAKETDLIILKNNSESWENNSNKNILQVKGSIKEYRLSLNRLQKSLENLEKIKFEDPKELYAKWKNLPSPRDLQNKLETVEDNIANTRKLLKQDEARLDSYSRGKCPECGVPTSKPGKVKELKSGIKNLKIKLKELKEGREVIRKDNSKLEKLGANYKEAYEKSVAHYNNVESVKNGIESNKRVITTYLKEIEAIKSNERNPNPYTIQITHREENLAIEKKKLSKINKEYIKIEKDKNNIEWAISEPLSNRGIKAYIFEHSLKKINRECRKYSKILGFGVNFSIDLESKTKGFQTTIIQGDKQRDYRDLSGGQQQLVDVCIAFAMHDVVSVNSNTNILIMDEIFESLDASNIEKVADLIKVKSRDNCVHLVTHRNDFVLQNCTNLKLVQKSYELAVRVV